MHAAYAATESSTLDLSSVLGAGAGRGGKQKGGKKGKKGKKKKYDRVASRAVAESTMDTAGMGLFGSTAQERSPQVLFAATAVSESSRAAAEERHREATQRAAASSAAAVASSGAASGLGAALERRADPMASEADAPATAAEMLLAGGPGAVLRGGPQGRVRRGGRVEIREARDALPDVPDLVRRSLASASHRTTLALVVAGHVDAGKSTLIGRMLYSLGQVGAATLRKFRREAERGGKGSFALAWVMDAGGDERERGVTVDVGMGQMRIKGRDVVLLDAPGHADFVPNAIAAAATADAGLLVVPAPHGDFKRAFATMGQTREHACLLRGLGCRRLIVAVNKMDACEWSKTRFDAVVARVTDFLSQDAGWDVQRDVAFVPVSGFLGSNVVEPLGQASSRPDLGWTAPAASKEASVGSAERPEEEGSVASGGEAPEHAESVAAMWYAAYCESVVAEGKSSILTGSLTRPDGKPRGPTLIECIDALPSLPTELVLDPLRLAVSDVRKESSGAVFATGRVTSGWVQQGDKLLAPPAADDVMVKAVKPLQVVADDSAEGFAAYMESDASAGAAMGGASDADAMSDAAGALWGGKKHKPCGLPGQFVEVQLGGTSAVGLRKGDVLSWVASPVPAAGEIKALLRVLPAAKRGPPLVEGLRMSLHAHNCETLCSFTKVVALVEPGACVEHGDFKKGGGKMLGNREWLQVRIRLSNRIPLVPDGDKTGAAHPLSAFVLRYSNLTVAAGLVIRTYAGEPE